MCLVGMKPRASRVIVKRGGHCDGPGKDSIWAVNPVKTLSKGVYSYDLFISHCGHFKSYTLIQGWLGETNDCCQKYGDVRNSISERQVQGRPRPSGGRGGERADIARAPVL
ncbi:hypothetical protein EVAR_80086_1 [Eumeta japonica]|uniref:Uncharacterized protein n=1 Tax=Eumeta variegata TaxID=151549 RepID=A0A4C1UCL4_EUMVA|nr:hypothetical protein EVAR_80086_1 [Eumeta japonica]